jgi:hypothetical protein
MNRYDAPSTTFAVKSGRRASIENTRRAIAAMEPFKTSGSLFGERGNYGLRWGNRLNATERGNFERVADHILYVVISYGTPIAWAHRITADGKLPEKGQAADDVRWVLVTSKFSATTTSHQSAVRQALMGTEWEDASE